MKTIFFVRTYHFLICSLTALTLTWLGTSCKKADNFLLDQKPLVQTSGKEISPLVKMYQNYFTSEILEYESKMLALSYKELPQNSEIRRNARMGKLKNLLLWDKAAPFTIGIDSYLGLPVDEIIKPFKNKHFEFYRNFVFNKNDQGKPNLFIIEILSKYDQSLGKNREEIIRSVIENIVLKKTDPIGNINGYMIVYNQNYIRQKSFDLINGKLSDSRISLNSELDINNIITNGNIQSN